VIVVDASVAVKWALDEDDSSVALALLDQPTNVFVGPDLLSVEVAGAVTRRVNMGDLDPTDVDTPIGTWLGLLHSEAVILHRTSSAQLLAAVHLAAQLRHPLKDCIYLALAIEHGCDLVSCDRRLLDKAAPIHAKVRHLYDF